MFEYYDPPDKLVTFIRVVKGEFKGILYAYGEVSFQPDEEPPVLKFHYDIVENPHNTNFKCDEFTRLAGDILSYLLRNDDGGEFGQV